MWSDYWFEDSVRSRYSELHRILADNHQNHLFNDWNPSDDDEFVKNVNQFYRDIAKFDNSYHGGLGAYFFTCKQMIQNFLTHDQADSLTGYNISIPEGTIFNLSSRSDSELFFEHETTGISEVIRCGFVIVAGGLGERLNLPPNCHKLSLPVEKSTMTSYIELYLSQIKHAIHPSSPSIAIMVSDHTNHMVREILDHLRHNTDFGSDFIDCVQLINQIEVPSFESINLKLSKSSPYSLLWKPHGHGDVHSLMHSSGIASDWLQNRQLKWVVFLQDTNGLALFSLAGLIGITSKLDLAMNSVTISRQRNQAIGGLVKFVNSQDDVDFKLLNVEYNQFNSLMSRYEMNHDSFPGNINQIVINLQDYVSALQLTSGLVPEFINPKLCDDGITFRSPCRLECLMQDFPKILDDSKHRVSFTQLSSWFCFSPVKNNDESAELLVQQGLPPGSIASGEVDQYRVACLLMLNIGCHVDIDNISQSTPSLSRQPRIVIHPSTALFAFEYRKLFPNPDQVHIFVTSKLVVKGDVVIESLSLAGELLVSAGYGSRIVIKSFDDNDLCVGCNHDESNEWVRRCLNQAAGNMKVIAFPPNSGLHIIDGLNSVK